MGPRIKNPQIQSIISMSGLLLLFTLTSLILAGLVYYSGMDSILPFMFISLGLFAIFFLAFTITWLSGLLQIRQISRFLASNRPLIRWQYTPQEWYDIKESNWEEDKKDWRVQWGCLTFLFGLIGLLVGVLVGAEEGLLEAVTGGLGGAGLGALAGATIGAATAGGYHLGIKYARQRSQPIEVAFAQDEFYANDSYYKVSSRSKITQIELESGTPAVLRIEAHVEPGILRARDLEWKVVVPDWQVEELKKVLPALFTIQYDASEIS